MGALSERGQVDPAMVQIIENHAEISGELLSVTRDTERPGFVVLHVHVTDARNVAGFPNMFARDIGQTITASAREGSAAATATPGPVTVKVKKTGPGMSFVEE
jgi:hypothetical protein